MLLIHDTTSVVLYLFAHIYIYTCVQVQRRKDVTSREEQDQSGRGFITARPPVALGGVFYVDFR